MITFKILYCCYSHFRKTHEIVFIIMNIWRKLFIFWWLDSLLSQCKRSITPECHIVHHICMWISVTNLNGKRMIGWSVQWQSAAMNIWLPQRFKWTLGFYHIDLDSIPYKPPTGKKFQSLASMWCNGKYEKLFQLETEEESYMWAAYTDEKVILTSLIWMAEWKVKACMLERWNSLDLFWLKQK